MSALRPLRFVASTMVQLRERTAQLQRELAEGNFDAMAHY